MNQARGSHTSTDKETGSYERNGGSGRTLDYGYFETCPQVNGEDEDSLGAVGGPPTNNLALEGPSRRGHYAGARESLDRNYLDFGDFDSDIIPDTPSPYLPQAKKRVTDTAGVNSSRKKPKLDLKGGSSSTNSEPMVPVQNRKIYEPLEVNSGASSSRQAEDYSRPIKHGGISFSRLNGKPQTSSKSASSSDGRQTFVKVQLNPRGSHSEEEKHSFNDPQKPEERHEYKAPYDEISRRKSPIFNSYDTTNDEDVGYDSAGFDPKKSDESGSSYSARESENNKLSTNPYSLNRPCVSSVQPGPSVSMEGVKEGRRAGFDRRSSESPDPVQQLHQVESDEIYARMLQEQFDSELVPHPPVMTSRPSRPLERRTSHSPARRYVSQAATSTAPSTTARQRAPSPTPSPITRSRHHVVSPLRRHQHRGRRPSQRAPPVSPQAGSSGQSQHSIPRRRSHSSRGATRNRVPVTPPDPRDFLGLDEDLDSMFDDSLFGAFDDDFFTVRVTIGGFGSPPRRRHRRWDDEDMQLPFQLDMLFPDRMRPSPRPSYRGRSRRHRVDNEPMFVFNNPMASEGDDYESLWQLSDQLGEVRRRGMSKSAINRLPTKVFYSGRVTSTDRNTSTQCHICMCDYETGEKLRILTCFHEFHSACIDKWLKDNATCPVCRVDVRVE